MWKSMLVYSHLLNFWKIRKWCGALWSWSDVCRRFSCRSLLSHMPVQTVHATFHVFALCSRNELEACLVWTFEHFHLSHVPTFLLFYSHSQKLRKLPAFLNSLAFPPAIEYLLLRCVWEQKKVWEQVRSAARKQSAGERGPQWSSGLFGTTRGVGWEVTVFFLCVVWVKSIFFLCGSCKESVFLFFCGECVGTAEWDGVIPEVNAISLRHT